MRVHLCNDAVTELGGQVNSRLRCLQHNRGSNRSMTAQSAELDRRSVGPFGSAGAICGLGLPTVDSRQYPSNVLGAASSARSVIPYVTALEVVERETSSD